MDSTGRCLRIADFSAALCHHDSGEFADASKQDKMAIGRIICKMLSLSPHITDDPNTFWREFDVCILYNSIATLICEHKGRGKSQNHTHFINNAHTERCRVCVVEQDSMNSYDSYLTLVTGFLRWFMCMQMYFVHAHRLETYQGALRNSFTAV